MHTVTVTPGAAKLSLAGKAVVVLIELRCFVATEVSLPIKFTILPHVTNFIRGPPVA